MLGSDNSIILPLVGLKQFYEVIGHFVEVTKYTIEGMKSDNLATSSSCLNRCVQ